MPRKHITIFPSGQGVDFFRAERGYDGVWLRSSVASWITTLLNAVLQSVDAADFTFSSFREIPCGDPASACLCQQAQAMPSKFSHPAAASFQTSGASILFHSESHPPAVAGDRFIPGNGGIRRQVQEFFNADFIDSLRKPDRPRTEIWIRHGGNGSGITIEDMLPNAYDAPRWLRETQGLNPEEAAAKAERAPCPDDCERVLSRTSCRPRRGRGGAAQGPGHGCHRAT